MIFIFTWIINCIHVIQCAWMQSNVKLPWPKHADEPAVGSYGNQVYIFGDYANPRQLLRYNVRNNTFADDGDVVGWNTTGKAQSWQQYANMLYMITYNTLSVYDFDSNQFINHWQNISFPRKSEREIWEFEGSSELSCLVVTDTFIFIIGGSDASDSTTMNDVQILSLLTYNWTFSNMIQARRSLSCAFDHLRHTLYAISGLQDDDAHLNSIEMTNINGIEQQSWTMLNDTLTDACWGSRALAHSDSNSVFIIGGHNNEDGSGKSIKKVHVINTITNTVSVSPERLPYKVTTTGAIIVDNIIYCFGGWTEVNDANALDTWIYYRINMTIDEPSSEPSSPQTLSPTNYPSILPSFAPIATPNPSSRTLSNDPTQYPSKSPLRQTTTTTDTSTTEYDLASFRSTFYPTLDTIQPSMDSSFVPTNIDSNLTSFWTTMAVALACILGIFVSICIGYYYYHKTHPKMEEAIEIMAVDHQQKGRDVGDEAQINNAKAVIAHQIELDHQINDREEAQINTSGAFIANQIELDTPQLPKRKLHKNVLEVQYWLQNVVQLEQYYEMLVENGYDSLLIIKEIVSETELIEIGIISTQHQTKLLREIDELKCDQEQRKGIGSIEGHDIIMLTQEGM